jgi:hypothetical protein
MALNIPHFTPILPTGNSFELYNNNRQTKPEPKTEKNRTGFPSDEVTLSISPEALKKSRPMENSNGTESSPSKTAKGIDEPQLNTGEKQVVRKLQLTDLHVKMHEQQHLASAGSYARGGASFQTVIGPDGKSYAVGGEVMLDTSPIPNNPQATIVKAQIVKRAALAPSDPSGADRAIAAAATQMEIQARTELIGQDSLESGSPSPKKSIRSGGIGQYFIKAYQNSLKYFQPGNRFNKLA